VSAGGGSVAWADSGGALRVGPHSAGADPGPAAYGLGGTEPTVTDADLLLGYLPAGGRLGGTVTLDADRARQALQTAGDRLGLTAEQAALGVVRVADTEMVRALRVISIERGLDPREFALVAFGGAGGVHACALADELGMTTVLVPRAGGVLSALGLAISDIRRDYAAPLLAALNDLDADRLTGAWAGLAEQAHADLQGFSGEPRLEQLADLRYRGQSYELTVAGGGPDDLRGAFHAAHERRYGYRAEDEPVEITGVRLVATVGGEQPEIDEPDPPADPPPPTCRDVLLEDGSWHRATVYDRRHLGRGSTVTGPAVVEFAEATCLVRPGWRGTVDATGTLVLARATTDADLG
jgi:N-methylhydantoinase A